MLGKKKDHEAQKLKLMEEMKDKEAERDKRIVEVGNIVHDSVVDSVDEENNAIVSTFDGGHQRESDFELLYHHEVLERIDALDCNKGSAIAGHRGYYLKNWGVRLNQALISYGMDFLVKRKYELLQTPFFMKKEIMAKTAQLSQFDEELYKVGQRTVYTLLSHLCRLSVMAKKST